MRPLETLRVKLRPLKADPKIAAIKAFQPGPIRTLYPISEADARYLLRAVNSQVKAQTAENRPIAAIRVGAGFGDPRENPFVEKAALRHVKSYFRKRGWNVEDICRENRGYDLICSKGRREVHVEVKGVRGVVPRFIITAGEHRVWQDDRNYKVAVVTQAISSPNLRFFDDVARLALAPIAYFAMPQEENG